MSDGLMTKRQEAAFGEAWAVFEALRRLGFRSDDIYFQVGGEVSPGVWQICVVLRAQGKEFTAIPCAVAGDPDDIEKRWKVFSQRIVDRDVPEEELAKIWEGSQALKNSAQLCIALLNKGFNFNGGLN